MGDKQIQKAGSYSHQFQVDSIVMNIGIDEKRAREIYEEMNSQLKVEYTQEALNIANARVTEFENRLLPKMQAVEGALQAFADPAFQVTLVQAQRTAASTERSVDYDLLTELLVHRFKNGENRVTRAGINRAVEIVDQISDEALLALTVFHSVSTFVPAQGNIRDGLDTLNDLFGKILYRALPEGMDWLDHLDILDAVRISPFGSLKTIEEYYPHRLDGYVDLGIQKGTAEHEQALQILANANLPSNILVDHELNVGFVRLNISDISQVDLLVLQRPPVVDGGLEEAFSAPLTESQKHSVRSVYSLYKKDEPLKRQTIGAFMSEWEKRPHLKALQAWWNSLKTNIQITSVGKVLAHSNAQRCDNSLPALD